MTERQRTHGWADPAAVTRLVAGLTGAEILDRVVRGEIAMPPMAGTIGYRLVSVEAGSAVVEAVIGEHLLNMAGTAHGGLAATLLDTAIGCALLAELPAGKAWTTIDLGVSYLRPLTPASGTIRTNGRIVHKGSRVVLGEGEIVDANGRVCAKGRMTCLLFEEKRADSQGPSATERRG